MSASSMSLTSSIPCDKLISMPESFGLNLKAGSDLHNIVHDTSGKVISSSEDPQILIHWKFTEPVCLLYYIIFLLIIIIVIIYFDFYFLQFFLFLLF